MKKITLAILGLTLLTGCVGTPKAPNSILPVHFIAHEFDGREWKVGYQARNSKDIISEWVVNNETVENWNELLTTRIHFKNVPIKPLASVIQKMMGKDCPTFETQVISEDNSNILFVWSHQGCQGHSAQREIRKILRGTDGIYFLSYAVKEQAYLEVTFQKWLTIIMKAELNP